MSFASEKLCDGYLRTNMSAIVSKVKVREIVVHLPCLTAHDRETIEAKREMCGNYDGMVLLLDCLKRRESWPEHFIRALEMCEHGAIAAEVRAEYDKLRGAGDSTRGSPPTAPPAPEGAASPPSPPRADPEPEVPTPAPAPPPVSPAPLATASPETTPPQEAERPDRDHPEPEESSESDIQHAEATPEEVSPGSVAPPQPAQAAEPCDVSESPPESPVDSDVTSAPPTPEKPPVQETAPPLEKVVPAAVIPPPDILEAPPTQNVVENCTATGSTLASPVPPATADAASACQSAPRTLTSVLPREDPNPAAARSGSPTVPYSGDSERLEISEEEEDEDEVEDEVQVNTVHVSQQPSVLNLDGQRLVNGDAAKEVASVQEPASTTLCPEPEKPAPRRALAANAKYMATAVGVGACALLLAWKLKH
ncbi:mitochondrial antiviral-signaling protein [Phyllopteryx taeniolatus]|uniref:mitochondrial antiviral-signaling protein n=1 Tax=Phyllopteryx taeniolatus TaxID=161469 RepID=UPI002AD3C601|nr:mitochondrial antiviral-signaling protein [Phyllopteryx taeniolatus]XP_061651554.1 mitochondrial antiviral-signaling protein [Phyllopteryx taeniolatus]